MLFEFEEERKNFNTEEGFIKGNMFPELYDEYKNYKPVKPSIKNQKEEDLYRLMVLDFAINDLNLYLATHPNDKEHFIELKKYNKLYKELEDKYEDKYGTLSYFNEDKNTYTYINDPWPWERFYV